MKRRFSEIKTAGDGRLEESKKYLKYLKQIGYLDDSGTVILPIKQYNESMIVWSMGMPGYSLTEIESNITALKEIARVLKEVEGKVKAAKAVIALEKGDSNFFSDWSKAIKEMKF